MVSTNDVMPRLCGFVIVAILVTIVMITSWNGGFEYENRIQIFSLIILLIWGVALWRAKGWQVYSRKDIGTAVCFFIYLALFLASTIWDSGTMSNTPIFAINAESEGIHRDTLYHNALASSIAAYGYPSLLINSDDFHNYHFGSHYILGMLARFMDMPTFFVYCYIFPILFLPSYTALILAVGRRLREYIGIKGAISVWDIVAVMIFMTHFILPRSWGDSIADWKTSWIGSESFLMANLSCLIFFYLLLYCLNKGLFTKKIFQYTFGGIIVPVFIVTLSLCKISVGAIFITAIIYYLVRKEGLCSKTICLGIIYAVVLLLVHYIPGLYYSPFLSATMDVSNNFKLFYFLLHDVGRGLQGVHLIFYFVIALTFFAWRIKEGMPTSVKGIIKSKKYILEETLAVVCVVGYLPGCVLAIGGGSSFYFSAIHQLYAVVLLIGFNIPQKIYNKVADLFYGGTVFGRRTIIVILLLICCNPLANTMLYAKELERDIRSSLQQHEESSKDKGYWYIINEINKITAGCKEDYYIYVCPSAVVWNRFKIHGDKNQDSALFFYPAMTGVVCIGELYHENGKLYTNDGKEKIGGYSYKPLAEEPKLSEKGAIEKARQDGKKTVIFIYNDEFRLENIN